MTHRSPTMRRALRCARDPLALVVALLLGGAASLAPAAAKTLVVGDAQELKTPSAAAAVVADGDTVEIEPHEGGYFDCAIWKANHITIEGKGADVVITDKSCAGKALFVIDGSDVTIRNLTFQRARVPDKNGAGIRAEGGNLLIEKSKFIDNENGILSADAPKASITIRDSEFTRNGKCDPGCSHGIYIGRYALLDVEHCVFRETRQGHHIKSRALRTVLVGNDIADGDKGTASYLVDLPNGGALVMRDNVMEKGPNSENHSAAVTIGEEGVDQPTPEITIEHNKFTNDMPFPTVFIRNGTATEAKLTGNTLGGGGKITPLTGDGSTN
jgi:hypothetical protein